MRLRSHRPARFSALAARAAILGSSLALASCGGGDGSSGDPAVPEARTGTEPSTASAPRPLSRRGVRVIEGARERVASHCRRVAQGPIGWRPAPSSPSFQRALAGLQDLARLATREPVAQTRDGISPRLALGDIAQDLQGTNCDRRLVAWIERALAGLP